MSISNIKPDFADIKAKLRSALSSKDSWTGILDSDTGDLLTSYFATISAYDQLAIESAYQETNIDTSKFDSSIRNIVRSLGVRMTRKVPAKAYVLFTRDTTFNAGVEILDSYKSFSVENTTLFNRDTIRFNTGSIYPVPPSDYDSQPLIDDEFGTITGTPFSPLVDINGNPYFPLYEGTIHTKQVSPDGTDFFSFTTNEASFEVSDIDSVIRVNGTVADIILDGLWNYRNDTPIGMRRVVQDTTIGTGEALYTFGSSQFGLMVNQSDIVVLTYVVTSGDVSTRIQGLEVTSPNVHITGLASTDLSKGANEIPSESYAKVAPQLFSSFGSAITRSDSSAMATTYPGVLDGLVRGQAEIAPFNPAWMNHAKISLLKADGTTLNSSEFKSFKAFYTSKSGYNITIERDTSVAPYLFNVNITLLCDKTVNLSQAKSDAETSIQNLYVPRFGILGSPVYVSDIILAAYSSSRGILHVQLASPLKDFNTIATAPILNSSITAQTSFLPISVISNYTIIAKTPAGDSLPSNITTVPGLNNSGESPLLTWSEVFGATGYDIYGRYSTDGLFLITSVGADVLTFIDDGVIGLTTTPLPQENSSAILFPKINTLTVTTKYLTEIQLSL